ncbi:MAG: polysaccharide biosynthesis tyrosine autokinase [Planctomycetota bacterium]
MSAPGDPLLPATAQPAANLAALAAPGAAPEGEDDELQQLWRFVRQSLRALQRRWYVVLLVVLLLSSAVFGRYALRAPRYYSRGVVQVGFHSEAVAGEDFTAATVANRAFQTQLKLLSSERVILAGLQRVLGRELPPGPERDEELKSFRQHLTIDPVRETFLVELAAWDVDARQSAERVNSVIEVFVAVSNEFLGSRFVAEGRQAREREINAQERFTQARERREAFLREHGQIPFDARTRMLEVRGEELEQRLASVDIELSTIAAEQSRIAANLTPGGEAPDAMLGRLGKHIDPISAQRLFEPIRALRAKLLRHEAQLTADHPEVVGLRLELGAEEEALRRTLRAASDGVRVELEQRALVLESEGGGLRRALEALEKQRFELNELHADYDRVNRDAEYYQKALEELRAQQWRAEGRSRVQMAATVLSRGEVPVEPTSPFTPPVIVLTLLLSLLLGAAGVVAWDRLDDTFDESSDLATLPVPVLGRIPQAEKVAQEAELLREVQGLGAAAEAMRLIRTNLTFALAGVRERVILITSPEPSEGKTLTSARLAVALAQTDGPVLLIEADMRRPRLQPLLELASDRGLAQVLAGLVPLEEAVVPTEHEHLYLLPAGSSPPSPGDLLVRGRIDEVLRAARARYSVVVIDSPPICGMADASLIAPHCDGVLVVARVGQTGRRSLQAGLEQLEAIGVHPAGLLLNGVPPKGGYGSAYGYYRPARSEAK